jgi:hypothetical protein
MAAGRAHSLVRRYLLGPAAVALPLLLLVAGLAAVQFGTARPRRRTRASLAGYLREVAHPGCSVDPVAVGGLRAILIPRDA